MLLGWKTSQSNFKWCLILALRIFQICAAVWILQRAISGSSKNKDSKWEVGSNTAPVSTSNIRDAPRIWEFPYGLSSMEGMHHWVIIPEYKLMACAMPKAGATSMRFFARNVKALEGHFATEKDACEGLIYDCGSFENEHLSLRDIQRMLQDPEWIKVAFFRDPKERLLSGYNDKCVREKKNCINFHDSKQAPSFDMFVQTLAAKIMHPKLGAFSGNDHYRSQSRLCGDISRLTGWLDYIGIIDQNVYTQMMDMMAKFPRLNTKSWKAAIDSNYNQTLMSNDQYMFHHNKKKIHTRAHALLKESYSPELERLADKIFLEDNWLMKSLIHHPNATAYLKEGFSDLSIF